MAAVGIATSALAAGGATAPGSPNVTVNTEDWNGASWSEVANLTGSRKSISGAGNTTNGLAFGGTTDGSTVTATTQEWSGSSNTTKTISTD